MRHMIKFRCPRCNSDRFGTTNEEGHDVRHCHGCHEFKFLSSEDWKYFVVEGVFDDEAEYDEHDAAERAMLEDMFGRVANSSNFVKIGSVTLNVDRIDYLEITMNGRDRQVVVCVGGKRITFSGQSALAMERVLLLRGMVEP